MRRQTLLFVGWSALVFGGGCDPEGTSIPVKTPTVHGGRITANETWSASDNPHLVSLPVLVGGAAHPTLTLEPGVEVRFSKDAGLFIGSTESAPGALHIDGTSEAPVLLTADADSATPGHWGGVIFGEGSTRAEGSRLVHVTVEYAGGFDAEPLENGTSLGAGVMGFHVATDTRDVSPLVLDHVVARKNQGYGLLLLGRGLGEGSGQLVLQDNTVGGLRITANEVGSLPADSQLAEGVEVLAGSVTRTQTWPKLGVAYRLVPALSSLPALLDVGGSDQPTLTLAPGTELRMSTGAAITVGLSKPGILVARGTAAAPILFVPDAASVTPGSWSGLHFHEAQGSALDQVRVSGAGALLFDISGGGGVNVNQELGAFMTRSLIENSSTCGVASPSSASVSTDFTRAEYGNAFRDNGEAAQCTK
jgi:hypothetical protein